MAPLSPSKIKQLYVQTFSHPTFAPYFHERVGDKFHVATQVYYLYLSLVELKKGALPEVPDQRNSSNGACFLLASLEGSLKRSFVLKTNFLLEDFGVPRGARREQLSYLLDKEHFAGVLPTFCIEWGSFRAPGLQADHYASLCSLQMYEDGCPIFKVPLSTINKVGLRAIAIHNLCCLQLDPGGNVLVRKNGDPFPIDYGYSLPETLQGKATQPIYCCEGPFTEKEKRHIAALSLEECSEHLRSCGLSSSAVRLQRAMLQIIKVVVAQERATLQDLVHLFYSGVRMGGGWRNDPPYTTFNDSIRGLLLAETEEGRQRVLEAVFKRKAVISL